jgi:methylated-DNA-[protein]-cysteine S-methyltransferase
MTFQSGYRTKRSSARVRQESIFSFETALGWIGIAHANDLITQIKFGYDTEFKLREQFFQPEHDNYWSSGERLDDFERNLKCRFRQFAAGEVVDFDDLDIEQTWMTPFQRHVTDACRAIPYGETLTYADLAAIAGSPKAARAVGTVMSRNRYPLLVPCHRVVGGGGQIGGYSAPDGVNLKLKLLRLEGAVDFVAADELEPDLKSDQEEETP